MVEAPLSGVSARDTSLGDDEPKGNKMLKAGNIFRSGALFVLGVLGVSAGSMGNARAESADKTSLGEPGTAAAQFANGRNGGPETVRNTPPMLTAEQLSDSLIGGNRAWRVDKKTTTTTAPAPSNKKTPVTPAAPIPSTTAPAAPKTN